eukprot:1107140-Lingulodinium_polyedra.AAC.1
MRYLHRTHRVAVAWLHERFSDVASRFNLAYEQSCRMCADLYTKISTDFCNVAWHPGASRI